ncbi:1,2-phenylacetyl-CoA epoxidase subunit PaaE [Alloalcanivorax xenomutans]|uniref:1,2-phenylacetyl-CoA epoxidase subunit PaaE n=1 Tax=Alloalcanivorax xenomutans TaxID=1094342 RepID=UPI00292E49CA|nr:1,2-phenylacetyl-CoA epoxidase subunit PaaE [Alloalcanivorax xenomutans]WOA32267.1 1,2-phenylacetyl-CoA epoxidase subunit PaaE [Alloalcanivorax xenomutans]
MNQFHSLKIREVRPETREAVSIAFDIPPELADAFRFTQGQHLIVRTHMDGEEVRRSYSICAGVNDGDLRVAVKKVPGGRFSAFANGQLKEGDTLEVMPPSGHFYIDLDPAREAGYLAVAAGSGITPILSIIKSTLETEPKSRFTLLYGNRSSNSTLFREALSDLKNAYLGRLNIIYLFSREQQDVDLYNGRLDADKCDAIFSRWLDTPNLHAAFLCGPQSMTETVRDRLVANGLEKSRVHFELFGVEGRTQRPHRRPEEVSAHEARTEVTIIADGREVRVELPRDSKNILDAANEQGADLPFSCKAGVCSTCRCKVVQGEVEMDNNFALEDYEVAAGYVLSCQSYPITDKVVLDFDQP